MTEKFMPFVTELDFATGKLNPEGHVITRNLSHMKDMYYDQEAVRQLLGQNPLIYVVYNVVVPETAAHIQHCVTILYPGKVGNEYFMTKGHYHEVLDRAEIYFCLKGKGQLLMQTQDGAFASIDMVPGSVAYVAPEWAHRTVNTGDEPFVFFAAYPGDAGHNYGDIETEGFAKLSVEQNGEAVLVDNPRYGKAGK
ncbi:glucose-6-phosphate isomerase [Paenibacillus cisolokensis]|jgi:Thermophilic glucose-6-phosphate isomerase and related metalloenzymes|uniref:glucose-6-phosphate isomerase n=1 Tax=Paenibacillus cisolokensis TaxID=1658519 RepID=A0ABQ4N1Q1_9BACL|nr:glucose-6-phosphate isomerase family protein [Paenibacillus cisolokensis]GIQ62084.1 glucose-6-phosphate isomerase [Paenibacillus cisolokensis]